VRGVSPVVVSVVLITVAVAAIVFFYGFVNSTTSRELTTGTSIVESQTSKMRVTLLASAATLPDGNVLFCIYVHSDDEFNYTNPLLSIYSDVGGLGAFTSFYKDSCNGKMSTVPCTICVKTVASPSTYHIRFTCDQCTPSEAAVSVT
jgi:L-ribulose-5-phosphate 3-epimerase UlaE